MQRVSMRPPSRERPSSSSTTDFPSRGQHIRRRQTRDSSANDNHIRIGISHDMLRALRNQLSMHLRVHLNGPLPGCKAPAAILLSS